ncbi:MAG: MarR family transcriptional regulator [Desulfosudis oleivorans]|nr:MarR family transcriptional regulator [Desulfosudis oleivorans]
MTSCPASPWKHPSLTVTEISFLTGFNQSTVSRILATLEKKKCVERETPGGKYRLGDQVPPVEEHPVAGGKPRRSGAAGHGETQGRSAAKRSSLYVPGEGNRICVEAVKSRYGVAKVTQVGKILPLHCGASGKVLLAHLPEKVRQSIICGRPWKSSPRRPSRIPEELEADLEKIRHERICRQRRESGRIGTYSVVAPVLAKEGKDRGEPHASAGPIFRLSDEQRSKNSSRPSLDAAAEISLMLGRSERDAGSRA